MRTFALLMLLLNMGYLVWHQISTAGQETGYPEDKSHFVPAAQSLVLLTERPQSATLPSAADDSRDDVPDSELENSDSVSVRPVQINESGQGCELVSGFVDQIEAGVFAAETTAIGIPGKVEIQQEQVSSTWWVHLPPFNSQLEAQKIIDELVAKGIDNFYMRTGELAGGISLGVFSREESARIAQRELLARGYETAIKEIPRYISKAYVILEVPDRSLLKTSEWQTFLTAKPNLGVSEKLCETIAR